MEQSLVGLVALPVALLNILGRRRPVLQLDAAAIAVHSAELIEATVFAAQTQPWLERWMGKVAVAGPWTPLMMTALSIGGQIAVNHGRMAPVPEFGIVSVADLQAKMEAAAQG
jgi:hypothetical protein